MQIEIWSDVVCPFCFIGKHRLEAAMEKFPNEKFEITWKSFQLNPDEITNPELNHEEHLSDRKGWSMQQMKQMHERVCKMGESCEIGFQFEKVKVVNSFDAHRLLHFAKAKGRQNELEEKLFKAYFEEGKNVGDKNILSGIAAEVGLNKNEADSILKNNDYTSEVKQDIAEAAQLNIHGVPFFVFDRKYALSGAQDTEVFEKVIRSVLEGK